MSRGILIVTTSPASPEVEDAYNAWYDEVHLAEVCSVPGFVSADRYSPVSPGAPYVAIYHLDTDDLPGAVASLRKAATAGTVTRSEHIATDPAPTMQLFEHRASLGS